MLINGKNPKMSNGAYHGDREYLSSSALKLILKNPHEYYAKYIKGDLSEEKAFFTFGNYIHSLILEPELVQQEYAIYEGAVRRGKHYEAFKEQNVGKLIITKSEGEAAEKIMTSYKLHKLAPCLFQGGEAEGTYATTLEGVNIKARLDYLIDGAILDVKTTGTGVDMQSLQSTIVKYDYDLSAALYLDVVNSSKKEKEFVKNFIFCFISKENYDIVLVQASQEMLENGRRKYRRAIARYKKLAAEGFFDPNKIQPDIQEIELPDYGRVA